jgi:hypothetical protein
MRDEGEYQGTSGPCPNNCKEALKICGSYTVSCCLEHLDALTWGDRGIALVLET